VEESLAAEYFRARIWGAPGALSTLGSMGLLIGLGRFRQILIVQLLTNGLNIVLDLVFVVGLDWGARGVGLGTAVAEWGGALLALRFALVELKAHQVPLKLRSWIHGALSNAGLSQTLNANINIMVRTLALLSGFAFFTNQGASFGPLVLAANHLLLQFISLSAFFLDGFAHVAESHLGRAKGAADREAFDVALRKTSEVALACALGLSITLLLFGRLFLGGLTDFENIVQLASEQVPWAAAYVALSVAAFQLDGVFIGAGATRAMRNTALISLAVFLGAAHFLTPSYQNSGLWAAFVLYVCARGLSLAAYLPALKHSISPAPS
jgi:MATE family multidrug resistance protein